VTADIRYRIMSAYHFDKNLGGTAS